MKNYFRSNFVIFMLFLGLTFGGLESLIDSSSNELTIKQKNFNKLGKIEKKQARSDFFFNIMRDPSTNSIPSNIRERELRYAKTLPKKNSLSKTNAGEFEWFEVGPNDIGGRTRALAVDVTNSSTVIAAGVSGGIWKSTNNGDTWEFKSKSTDILSITSIVQDPRSGFTNTWYAVGGELIGNSASDRGFTTRYRANGIFKSTDNGENWDFINSMTDPTKWDSDLDYMSKVIINPMTGSIFGAANGYGIIKSIDGGLTYDGSLGGTNDHYFSDIIVKSDGTLISVLSSYGATTTPDNSPGIYKSTDDGETWVDITPASFPSSHERSVLGTSNLATPIFYVLTYTGELLTDTDKNENVTFFKMSTDNSVTEDLTANLPEFDSEDFTKQGHVYTQNNYNMAIAVKPDDDNFILFAGTSLFRSTDGLSTKLISNKTQWIGGYHATSFFYPDLHPDIHIITFDPNDANKVWVGHDGGLSYSDDITTTTYSIYFPWINKNNSYNVTQFYTVGIPRGAGDFRIMGGTQDNGSPFFNWNNLSESSEDISSGDGAYCHFTSTVYLYCSTYEGNVYRYLELSNGELQYDGPVKPEDASDQLFVNPFAIDLNPIERYMYYPAGKTLWRNDFINNQKESTDFWTKLTNLSMPTGYTISTLSVSNNNPQHVLYYGGYNSDKLPLLYRLEDSHTATEGYTDVSVPSTLVETGWYIHDIAVNPDDGNEIITVFSNYNIDGLFHSTDGGSTYTSIEGNLVGDEDSPGPSIRRAIIFPYDGSYIYFLATSTGLYSTSTLDGENTIWELESPDDLGNVVVEYLDYRTSDNTIAVGTHGRGIFLGMPAGTVDVDNDIKINSNYSLSQNYPNPFNPSTKINFNLSKAGNADLTIYNSLGEKVETLLNKDLPSGNYSIDFDGTRYASGIYYYKLSAGNFINTKKMILMK